MINALGEVSTAAHTIANTVESAFYIPGWGMQTAAATLSGFAFGEKNREKLRRRVEKAGSHAELREIVDSLAGSAPGHPPYQL